MGYYLATPSDSSAGVCPRQAANLTGGHHFTWQNSLSQEVPVGPLFVTPRHD